MNVKFTSCFSDRSGYAQAARDLLRALVEVGVNVTTEVVSFQRSSDPGISELALKLQNKKIPYDIKIIMLTPEMAMLQLEKGKYNIEILFWEVLGVDPKWVNYMNFMDEVWTPSQTFADTFKKHGVTSPLFVLKQPSEIKKSKPYQGFDEFLFYSVFQWTERKNPKGLLQTYWRAFQDKNDVALLLKTYRSDFSESEKEAIRADIRSWKREMPQVRFPKVYLALNELNTQEMERLHATGDCFVSAHRGEGWGYPQMEAMAVGKPVISTNFGGIHEHLDNNTAWLIDYSLTKVQGMNHIPWYNETQLWANPNYAQLAESMLNAYGDREGAQRKGKRAQDLIKKDFTYKKVGEVMKRRLERI